MVGRPCGYHVYIYIYTFMNDLPNLRLACPGFIYIYMGHINGSNMFYIMEMDLLHPQWYTHPQFLPIGHEYMLAM